ICKYGKGNFKDGMRQIAIIIMEPVTLMHQLLFNREGMTGGRLESHRIPILDDLHLMAGQQERGYYRLAIPAKDLLPVLKDMGVQGEMGQVRGPGGELPFS